MNHDEQFTISVRATDVQAGFSFGDLVLKHAECGGGQIKQKEDYHGRWWYLKCLRCSREVQLEPSQVTTGAIALTAVDGVRRSLGDNYRRCSVIQEKKSDERQTNAIDPPVAPTTPVFRVALASGAWVDIRAAHYAQEGGRNGLWHFYDNDGADVASFDAHAVGAIVRVDSIVGGSPPRIAGESEDDAESVDDEVS
jgi:hypothetical protein